MPDSANGPAKDESAGGISLEIRWGDASDVGTIYANNLYITHTDNQFYLVFGELQLPLILDAAKERDRMPEWLSIKPVAKIAIAPEAFRRMAEAINQNLEKYQSKREKADRADG